MRHYEGDLSEATAFLTDQEVGSLQEQLVDFFNNRGISYNLCRKAMKIHFTHAKQVLGGSEIQERVEMQVEFKDADDGQICVQFKRKSGSTMMFYSTFNDIRNEMNIVASNDGAQTPTFASI